jgi:hypothetical protein
MVKDIQLKPPKNVVNRYAVFSPVSKAPSRKFLKMTGSYLEALSQPAKPREAIALEQNKEDNMSSESMSLESI